MPVSDDERARYEAVEEFLSDEERQHIEDLRIEHGEDRYNHYGHDLMAAIARGHRNRARELIQAAGRRELLAGSYGKEPMDKPRLAFSLVVSDAIQIAALQGASADEIRRSLQRHLDTTDHFKIERRVERAQK